MQGPRRKALPTSPAEPPVTVEADIKLGTATVVISGELDLVAASFLGQLLAPILAERPQYLVFHLGGVSFIDCAAARLIIGTGRSLPAGRRPVIRPPSVAVRRILKLTGLDTHCEIDG
jgi:anti-anti-sigma factor